jgi:transmembrane protein 17
VVASLALQKLLYFNAFYAAAFAVAHIALCIYKLVFIRTSTLTRFALPVIVALWCACELLRLRLGYHGNLREKVPELSAFWLISVFPQLPLVVYLSYAQPAGDRVPLDLAVGLFMTAFVVSVHLTVPCGVERSGSRAARGRRCDG